MSAAFVNDPQGVLLPKASEKINEMSLELYQKTGLTAYLNVYKKLPSGQTITTVGKARAADFNSSFVLINFSSDDRQVDLISSTDLQSVINKDEILDEYIIPILVSQDKKTSLQQKYSAGLLNGMAETVDKLAAHKNITLTTSIGSESKDFYDGLLVLIKIMLVVTILAIGYAWLKRKQ